MTAILLALPQAARRAALCVAEYAISVEKLTSPPASAFEVAWRLQGMGQETRDLERCRGAIASCEAAWPEIASDAVRAAALCFVRSRQQQLPTHDSRPRTTNMSEPAVLPKIDMFCTTGGASKEYHLFTTANAAGDFTLHYSNGKIGDPMKPKVKAGPGTLEAITKVFDKTVREKKTASPPYTEAADGVAYSVSEGAGELSGWLPQLLTEVQPEDVAALLDSPEMWLQEKHFGERRGLRISSGGDVKGMNKKGRYVGGIPQAWVDALKTVPGETILDGEHVGDVFHVFDAPMIADEDLTDRPYSYREARLRAALASVSEPTIRLVSTETTPAGKRALLDAIEARMGEGGVFRRAGGRYTPGSSPNARSADCLKYKFYESSTCIVRGKNDGNSVSLEMLDASGSPVPVGSVTIPPNHAVPPPGALVEVRYMHMFEGGRLYGPPVYLGPRTDVDRTECTLSQVRRIKAKSSVEVDEEPDDADQSGPRLRMRA